jgi:methionyl-tRNA synthetase
MAEHIDAYRLRKAQEEFLLLARLGNRYIDDTRPWETRTTDPARCQTTLAVGARLLRTLAVVMAPFLPASSRRLWKMIGLEGSPDEQPWDTAGTVPLPEPLRIGKVEALYEKIDDETIEAEILKLKERISMSEQSPEPAPADASGDASEETTFAPLKDPVTIDDFARLDLRVGQVIAAEPLEGADKLLLLRIDIGLEVRQVVSGIRAHYDPAELIGSQVILFANLEPRKIRGTLSRGMVLAADHEGIPTLLTPNRAAIAGSIVR